ncbi:E3 ubiquitin-protein ligase CHIP [Candida viswanathii]|uniref:RING-type E3 ubiquitin transferase n=1 Tax=Candida viswanathii TaxID=5486 RepID=A0A367XV63_9ASCO|nr:E3 ubiquitin-protein ligase CHIP [Candida viswanathii]
MFSNFKGIFTTPPRTKVGSKGQENLDKKHHHHNHLSEYYSDLFALLKVHLEEYSNLLDTFQNNYVHSLYEDNLMNYKLSKPSRSNSVFSSKPSIASSTQETERPSLDDDAPEHFLDPISFELFTDPVITPSGITYEKSHLIGHLKTRGKFDPITRQELTEGQLYPNLIMKDAIEAYRKETGA